MMAIQPNRRKRKHAEAEAGAEPHQDEGELAVPKKLVKESSTPKQKKKKSKNTQNAGDGDIAQEINEVSSASPNEMQEVEEQQVRTAKSSSKKSKQKGQQEQTNDNEDEISPDSGIEPEEKADTQRFPNDFKMLNFRTKLRGNSFITELRHFLHMCQTTRPKLVAKYIEKRGKPLELAEAFDRVDKSNILHVDYLTEALQRVVMEILTNQKSHMESAAHGCRYFLKAHGGVLEQLLQSTKPSHRRNALKLLTAMVCVEPQLGRQILNSYDILSNVKTMSEMLSHSKNDFQNAETVRKAYIHFVLAFLVDGNSLLIRNILDRGQLIGILVQGLVYDDHVTVCVVLNALRQYVLENPDIQKTKKVLVFDLECCKHLRRLYDWQGPKALPALYSKKKNEIGSQVEVTPEELQAVSLAAHELLVILLTSRKHGIAFDAMTHYRQKHNKVQGKLLGSLYKPYKNPLKWELVIKTLKACPDLGRATVRNFSAFINAGRLPVADLPNGMKLLAEIIEALPPSSLSVALDKMTLTDLGFWIKQICLPVEALLQLTGKKLLSSQSFAVRLGTNRLLLSMMQQYSNYMNAIALREQSKKAGNSLRKFKFDLLNHLLVHFPPIEFILLSLYTSIQQQTEPDVDVLEHLSVTLDLILIMCNENKAFVKKTSQILDYLDVLRPLYETNFDNLKNNENKNKIQLELKSIKTILMLFPRALDPQEKLFEKVFRSFVKAYMLDDVTIKTEAGNILNRLFHNTGMFDSCRHEIDIWMESVVCFDAAIVENVTSILLAILSLDWRQITLPELDMAETASNVKNLGKLFAQIEQGQTVQAFVETLTLSKMMPLLLEGVSLDEPYDAYVELVFILLFHYHSKPGQVLRLYDGHLIRYKDYFERWLLPDGKNSTKTLPPAINKLWPQLNQLLKEFLKPKNGNPIELVFNSKDEVNGFQLLLEEGNSLVLHSSLSNPRRNNIYVQELLFVLTHLFTNNLLTLSQAELMADYLIRFLQIACQLDGGLKKLLESGVDTENDQHTESHTENLLHYIYGIRLSQLPLTQLFSETNETNRNYIIFLRRLTEHCRILPGFANHTANYRLQLSKSLDIGLATTNDQLDQQQLLECVALIDAFDPNAKECSDMFELLMVKATAKDFFVGQKQNHYYDLLLRLLTRLAGLKEPIDCTESMAKLCGLYKDLNTLSESQLEPLESALCQFLENYHHHLSACNNTFFSTFFNPSRKLSKSAIRLACLLLERQTKLAETFIELLPNHLDEKELIYPLLDVAFSKNYQLPQALLQRCYQTYKSGFMKSIEKPQKAALIYREHPDASCALIAQCMPKSECLDYCQKQLKLDSVELFQMRVLREIYWQALAASKDDQQRGTIFVSYVNLQIQMLSLDLKKQSVHINKVEQSAWNCYDWWLQITSSNISLDWSRLINAPHWLNYCKTCLKMALHLSEDSQQQQQADQANGLLLKLLAFLCDRLFVDYKEEDQNEGDLQTPALLYEMICTHSCTFDHLLGAPSEVKTHILNLMETLARKAPAALHSSHIPVILGSYQAKLSPADRYALALLEHYEYFDVGLEQFRPFIWGESAVAHYALRAADEDERAKLQQQETNVAQVLALIVRQTCEYTIENFPIWRSLHAREQLPKLQFDNPLTKCQKFGDNLLEQMVEQGCQEYDKELRRICPKREEIYENCYDPAFMVPLMLHCFAPESVVRARWPVQNGLLALSFCALSSLDKDMRLAAACAQQRYRTHFELSKFYERPLWTQAYDNIQAGLSELRTSWLAQRRTHGGTPRVPLIPALFIAHSFKLSTEPTHLLYKRLMMYLRLKQSFNFQTIPDFNVFFYSPEPEHQQYREFIVELLRCGIKCSADLFLLVSTNTFKVLLGFYGSSLATLDTNLLLLSVLSTCVKIPGAVKIMLEHAGILPWLVGVIRDTEFHQFDIIEGIISIINNLWYAMAASQSELPDYAHLQLRIHRLVFQLLPLLSPRISVPGLSRLLNILWKTATICGQHRALSAEQLDQLLECLARHWPDQLSGIRYVRNFGGSGASSYSEYCKWLLQDQQLDGRAVQALSSLREYISDWWLANNTITSNDTALDQPIKSS